MSSYFSIFPTTYYWLSDPKQMTRATNILKKIIVKDNTLAQKDFYNSYYFKDTDTVESISHKLYGSVDYGWVIFLMNKTFNPYYDFPLSNLEFDAYLDVKYPGTAVYFLTTDDIYQKGESVTWDSGSSNAVVESFDNTTKKLVLTDIEGTLSAGDIITGDTSEASSTAIRVVVYNKDSLNRFTENGEPDGRILDPYWVINTDEETEEPFKYASSNFKLTTMTNSARKCLLYTYIQNDSEFADYIITNYTYENHINEQKRNIKLLKPEFLTQFLEDFNDRMKQ